MGNKKVSLKYVFCLFVIQGLFRNAPLTLKIGNLVMIGYSDSAKDAGRLAASWAQYETQEALVSNHSNQLL